MHVHEPVVSGHVSPGHPRRKQDEDAIHRLCGERSVPLSLLFRTLLDLTDPVVDTAPLHIEQEVSPVGRPSQGGLPQEDNLVLDPHEEGEVRTSGYTGRRYATPASPNLLPHPPVQAPSVVRRHWSAAPVSHGNAATAEPPAFDLAAKDTDEAEEDFFPQLARAEA